MSLIKLTITFLVIITLVYLGKFSFDKIEYKEPSYKTIYERASTININLSKADWFLLFKDKSTTSYPAKIKINESETVNAKIRFGGQSTREVYQFNPDTMDLSSVTIHGRIHRWLEPNIDFKLSPFDEDPSLMKLKFAHDFFSGIFTSYRIPGFIPRTNYAFVNIPPAPTYLALFTEPIDKTFFEIRNYPRILHKSSDKFELMSKLQRDLYPRYKDYFEEGYLLTYILIEYYLSSENPILSYGDSENFDLYFDSYSKKNYPIPNDLDAVLNSCNKQTSEKWNLFNEDRVHKALTNIYQNSENKKELSYLIDAIYTKIYTENYGLVLAAKNLEHLKKCCSSYMPKDHEKHYKNLLEILECQRQKMHKLITLIKNTGIQ